MALTPNTTVQHISFGERPDYASPYPEGIAVAHVDVTGDASGNPITVSIFGQDQFLYRLELINVSQDAQTTNDLSLATVHDWATEASGFGTAAFSLNWQMSQLNDGGFAIWTPYATDLPMMRRFPIGSIRQGAGQFIAVFTMETNIDTRVFDFDAVFTYWPKQAMFAPGFLSSFYEAPEVAPLIP